MIIRKNNLLNKIDPSILFLGIAMLIGGYIRLSQVLQSDFPVNDGGLFYTMTSDLIANGFRLPLTTSYNHLNLPFAYPPLFFYLAGFLVKLTSWRLIDIIRVLPAIFTVLAIPAFYLLASVFIKNKYQLILATLIFTFIPASFDWLIMGGGLTRSPALFLALISLYFIYRLYTQNRLRDVLWVALFSSLTVLSHPETALHTAASAVVFFIFFGRNKKGLIRSVIVAGLVLLLTAPWWGTILVYHGFAPFFAATETGLHNIVSIFQLILKFNITHEYALQTIGVLALIGLFWRLSERKYFLPVWVVVIYLSEPRSAPLFLVPCMAILASYTLFNILQLLNKTTPTQPITELDEPQLLLTKVSGGLFLLLFAQWVFSAMATISMIFSATLLSNFDSTAFAWIKANTPVESRFLVLTGNAPLSDPVVEWFPALAERTSVSTIQGREWDSSVVFEDIFSESQKVQQCIYLNYDCIQSWSKKNNQSFNYLYIHNPVLQEESPSGSSFQSALGVLTLAQGYTELVFENNEVSIFKLK
jgi:hypothetical protein